MPVFSMLFVSLIEAKFMKQVSVWVKLLLKIFLLKLKLRKVEFYFVILGPVKSFSQQSCGHEA